MQRSWPLVRTRPLASSSRNFAGRIIRPFSSRRGECVPRNTAHRPSVLESPTSPVLPLPSYALHITPHRSTVNDTPGMFRQICGCLSPFFPAFAGKQDRWGKVERFCLLASSAVAIRGADRPQRGNQFDVGTLLCPDRSKISALNGERPAEAGLAPSPVYRWREVEGLRGRHGLVQDSPPWRSSQRCSRLLMNELRGLPLRPAARALPTAELRMVAK